MIPKVIYTDTNIHLHIDTHRHLLIRYVQTFTHRYTHNNNNEKFILRLKMLKQTQGHKSLHFGRAHDYNLEACCRGISSCKAGDNPKQPSSHRHCYQNLNGAKLRFSDLPNDDSSGRDAGCSLMSYPGCLHRYPHTSTRRYPQTSTHGYPQTSKLRYPQTYMNVSRRRS